MPRSEPDQPRAHTDDEGADVEGHSLEEPRAATSGDDAPRMAQDEDENADVEAHGPRLSPRSQPRT